MFRGSDAHLQTREEARTGPHGFVPKAGSIETEPCQTRASDKSLRSKTAKVASVHKY